MSRYIVRFELRRKVSQPLCIRSYLTPFPRWSKISDHLEVDALGRDPEDRAIAVAASKRLPRIQIYINIIITGNVLISNDGLPGDTVVVYGDRLGVELVVLPATILAKNAAGNRNEGHVGIDLASAKASRPVLPE